MVGPDSDARYHPENGDVKPRWIPVQEMVGEGTIGFTLVSQIPDLGVRLRPESIFNQQPLASLWPLQRSLLSELQDLGYTKASDLLSLSEEQLSAIGRKFGLRERVREYIEGVATLTHARLAEAVWGKKHLPIPPQFENQFVTEAEAAIDRLPVNENIYARNIGDEVLRVHYGLRDGIIRIPKDVSDALTLSWSGVMYHERRALRALRNPQREFPDYSVFPDNTFGHQLGLLFVKDLPKGIVDFGLDISRLSPATVEELDTLMESGTLPGYKDRYVLSVFPWIFDLDLEQAKLSQNAQAEIAYQLERFLEAQTQPVLRDTGLSEHDLEMAKSALSRFIINQNQPELDEREISTLRIAESAELYIGGIRTVGDFLRYLQEHIDKLGEFDIRTVWALSSRVQSALHPTSSSVQQEEEGLRTALVLRPFVKQVIELTHLQTQPPPLSPGEARAAMAPGMRAKVERMHEARKQRVVQELQEMRIIVTAAQKEGLTTVEQIQERLAQSSDKIIGNHALSFPVKAMIEYVLNHPEENQ